MLSAQRDLKLRHPARCNVRLAFRGCRSIRLVSSGRLRSRSPGGRCKFPEGCCATHIPDPQSKEVVARIYRGVGWSLLCSLSVCTPPFEYICTIMLACTSISMRSAGETPRIAPNCELSYQLAVARMRGKFQESSYVSYSIYTCMYHVYVIHACIYI